MPMFWSRPMVSTEVLAWIVAKTRWPVSEAWMAIFGGLVVSDLADHDHVRILSQNGAQGPGEGEGSFPGRTC